MFFDVQNLNFAYLKSSLTLKDVNFSLAKFDKALLLASKEQGKTTFVKVVSSFDSNYFGKILLEGKELKTIPDEAKGFSVHLSCPVLLENKTIKENFEFLFSSMNQECLSDEKLLKSLKEFDIEADLKTKTKKLSLFDKRKFQIIRTLLRDTKILFVDDVFEGLLEEEMLLMLSLYEKYFLSKKCTVIVSVSAENYKKLKENLKKIEFSKILYLNLGVLKEFKNLSKFEEDLSNFDMINYANGFESVNADLSCEKSFYIVEFAENKFVRLDTKFNEKLKKLKLDFADSEPIKIVFKHGLNIDNLSDDEFNKLVLKNEVLLFSNLDGERLI